MVMKAGGSVVGGAFKFLNFGIHFKVSLIAEEWQLVILDGSLDGAAGFVGMAAGMEAAFFVKGQKFRETAWEIGRRYAIDAKLSYARRIDDETGRIEGKKS